MWTINEEKACLDSDQMRAMLDLQRPTRGLEISPTDGSPERSDRILCLDRFADSPTPTWTLSEKYVRGTDLITTYDEPPPSAWHGQVYWKSVSSNDPQIALAIETSVSIHSSGLSLNAGMRSTSEVYADEILRLQNHLSEDFQTIKPAQIKDTCKLNECGLLFIFRSHEKRWAYVEMIHPSDVCTATLQWNSTNPRESTLSFTMLPDELEKGVIRLVRLKGAFVACENDREIAREMFKEFVDAPLPLTT